MILVRIFILVRQVVVRRGGGDVVVNDFIFIYKRARVGIEVRRRCIRFSLSLLIKSQIRSSSIFLYSFSRHGQNCINSGIQVQVVNRFIFDFFIVFDLVISCIARGRYLLRNISILVIGWYIACLKCVGCIGDYILIDSVIFIDRTLILLNGLVRIFSLKNFPFL